MKTIFIPLFIILYVFSLLPEKRPQEVISDKNDKIYTLAIQLSVLGEVEQQCYDYAGSCLAYLAAKNYSDERWFWNNAGVNKAMAAIKLFSSNELKFALPFELEVISSGGALRAGDTQINRRKELLLEAKRYFLKAVEKDESYTAAYSKLGGGYVLREEFDLALDNGFKDISLAESQNNTLSKARAHIMLAYIYQSTDRLEKAIQELDFAKKLDAESVQPFLDANLALLESKKVNFNIYTDENYCSDSEKIEGQQASEVKEKKHKWDMEIVSLDHFEEDSTISISLGTFNRSDFVIIQENDNSISFIQTLPTYSDSTCFDIKIGDHQGLVRQKYNTPCVIRTINEGAFWVYRQSDLIFWIKDKKVSGWSNYYINTSN
mgnify:CR=1 FL=1